MPDLPFQGPLQEEIELKFEIPPPHLDALSKAMRSERVRVQRLQSIYYDTSDGQLAARGASVRLRKEGRHWVQTAKALTVDSLRRLEHNVNVPPGSGKKLPRLDLSRHDGTAVGAAIHAALWGTGKLGSAVLVERFRVDVSRVTRIVLVGGASVELALDTGQILAAGRSEPICEFEMELKHGPVAGLLRLAIQWTTSNELWLSTLSKAARGEALLCSEAEGRAINAVTPTVDTGAGRPGLLFATLKSCLTQILGNASEIGAGATQEQLVHELRVGLRRMRTALREFRDFAPGVDDAWGSILCRTFQELGAHRDAALVIPSVLNEMREAGVDSACAAAQGVGARSPKAIVQDPEFQRVLLCVIAFCHATPTPMKSGKDEHRKLCRKVSRRLGHLHALLLRDAGKFDRLSPTRQHRVRKRLKRLRYLAEFAAPLFDAKGVAKYLAHWGDAQDALGEQNDYRIALTAFRADKAKGHHAKSARRWLGERLKVCVKRCARSLKGAVSLPAFWEK